MSKDARSWRGWSSSVRRGLLRLSGFAVAAFLAACATTPGARLSSSKVDGSLTRSAAAMRAHMGFLASDLLQGRNPGTPGYDIAAGYVASQFALAGAKPAGGAGSYLQTVRLVRFGSAGNAKLSIKQPSGEVTDLIDGQDYLFVGWPTRPRATISAPLAFAGYGIAAPELGRDDYGGLNVAGKIVIVLEGVPSALLSGSASRFSDNALKREEAGKRGALGIIVVTSLRTSAGHAQPYPATVPPLMTWRRPDGAIDFRAPDVGSIARVGGSGLVKLLAGGPVTIDQIRQAAASPDGRMPAVALPSTISANLSTRVDELPSANVAGLIKGSDPALRDQVVVLSAHLDHLGILPAVGGDTIANGALDNASGVATLLEVGRMFRESRTGPRRSVLLLAVTAEERGLLGSDYFVRYPSIPRSALVADVNLDMPILTYAFTDVVVLGGERSTIGAAATRAAARIGVQVSPASAATQALFSRSDQLSFAQFGIPSIFLRTGTANGGDAASDAFDARCYHAVCDDLAQPIDYQAAARFALLNYEIARELANAPERPHWNAGDPFALAPKPDVP